MRIVQIKSRLANIFFRLAHRLDESPEDDFADGFDGIPSSNETDAMSARNLARILNETNKDTPAYTILSHELNVKIAKIQSKATIKSGWLSGGGAIIGALIALFIGISFGTSPQQKEINPKDGDCSVTYKNTTRPACNPCHIITNNKIMSSTPVMQPNTKKGNNNANNKQ